MLAISKMALKMSSCLLNYDMRISISSAQVKLDAYHGYID